MEAVLPCLIIPEGAEEVVAVDHQPREPVAVAALPWKASQAAAAAAEVAGHHPREPEEAVAVAALPWIASPAAGVEAAVAGLQP